MKPRLLYLFRLILVLLLSFLLQKLLFLLFTPGDGRVGLGDALAVLYHGLSLDLSVLGYLLIVPLILLALSFLVKHFPARRILRPYHLLVALLLGIVTVVDLRLYPFWGFKLDASVFLYLDSPGEAFASVSLGFILANVFLIALWSALVFFALGWRLEKSWPSVKRGWIPALGTLVLLAPTFLLIRGGVSQATANVGQVYFSDRQYLNHAAVNPIFSLFSSLGKTEDFGSEYNFYSDTELAQLTADLFPAEAPSLDTLLTTRRPNILVIIMESFGARYIGALGGMAEVSPHFDRLSKEGILFSSCYANSFRTDRGVLSTLSGYPSFPTHSVMKLPAKIRSLSALSGELRKQGYSTDFLYGGDANFTNMKGYLLGSGYQRVTDEKDLDKRLPRTNWGVPDGVTFDYLYEEILRQPTDKPWHKGFLTLSSHEPFDVPYKRLASPIPNAFAYLDESLGKFVERLKKTPQWKDLLIICLADHGFSDRDSDDRNGTAVHHIPLLWLGGAVRSPRVLPTLMNQSDLVATLLAQLGLPYRDFPFSRNVLAPNYTKPFAYYTFNDGFGFIDPTGSTVVDNVSGRVLEDVPTPSPLRQRLGRALLQMTHDDLARR